MTTAMPRILDCSVTSCSYNKTKSCSAAAITVGYASTCTTFIPLSVKGAWTSPSPSWAPARRPTACTTAPSSAPPTPFPWAPERLTASPTRRGDARAPERDRGPRASGRPARTAWRVVGSSPGSGSSSTRRQQCRGLRQPFPRVGEQLVTRGAGAISVCDVPWVGGRNDRALHTTAPGGGFPPPGASRMADRILWRTAIRRGQGWDPGASGLGARGRIGGRPSTRLTTRSADERGTGLFVFGGAVVVGGSQRLVRRRAHPQ